MNYSTGLSKPSQYALMKMTGIKRSSISRALKNLETLGIIEVIPHISTKGRRNIYKIRIYQEGKINAPSEASTVKLNDIDIENLIEKRFHLE
jgi:DNA-binding MarR family transcriptional regulator